MSATDERTGLTVELPLPARALCGNGKAPRTKGGFIARNATIREQRQSAARVAGAALRASHPALGEGARLYPVGRVRIDVTVYRSPEWAARRLDDDNLWRGMKSQIDGLADAGVVSNDRQFRLGRITWEKAAPLRGRIVLTLTAEAEREAA